MAAGSADLVPLYYLCGIGASVGGGVIGVRSYMARQRERWLDEGKKEANLADQLEQNSRGQQANTEAINGLRQELHTVNSTLLAFVEESRRRFENGDMRFSRIERDLWGGRGSSPDRDAPGERDRRLGLEEPNGHR
jgi:hypothetical protein